MGGAWISCSPTSAGALTLVRPEAASVARSIADRFICGYEYASSVFRLVRFDLVERRNGDVTSFAKVQEILPVSFQ